MLPKEIGPDYHGISLPHPKNNRDCPYLYNQKQIFEVLEVDRSHSSWFVGDRLISNGSILLVSPIHPLFLVIPLMRERGKDLYLIDEYFADTIYEPISHLVRPYFPTVCTAIPFEKSAAWSIDDNKLLNWLCDRVMKLVPYMKESAPIDDHMLVEMAFDVVSNYLRGDLAQMLKTCLTQIFPVAFSPRVLSVATRAPPAPKEAPKPSPKPLPKPKIAPKKEKKEVAKPKQKSKRGIDSFFAPAPKT